ncbi:MAG: PAS domain S-box protein [Elusimicrobia bacterium]|nr:PAS domain S-box protein [Elusimicrobiota bacterium]
MGDSPQADPAVLPRDLMTQRYQRLVLLNRMSVALFGDKPFAAALPEACHAAMALMGAQSVEVFFADELGRPVSFYRHADKRLAGEPSHATERELLTRALGERKIVTATDGLRSWEAAPLLRLTAEVAIVTGGVVFGRVKAEPLDSEREGGLVEIARHLRNARMIQQTLQHQKISAAIVDQSADAIFVTDLHEKILTWNAGAEDLLQWRLDEVLGRHGAFLVPPERVEQIRDVIAEVHAKGFKNGVETERVRKDGSLVAIEGTFTLLKDDSGEAFAIVRSYRDITKRKQIERMKSEFTALVSHELRTPLTAIRGFAETLRDFGDELDTSKRGHYLQIILDEATRLGHMVNDFLDIARIESGGIETNLVTVKTAALFDRVERLFKEHKSKPRFVLSISPGAETIHGDEEQLYRLFVNLVGNALKYTPEGGRVALSAIRAGTNLELSVADEGPGIAKADLPRLFEKFYRAGDAITRKTPGTGLGLAICKGIVDAHRGTIRAESEPGKGARFVARLPNGTSA